MDLEPKATGLSLVVDPSAPTLDVVLVHGFNGDALRTWRHKTARFSADGRQNDMDESVPPKKVPRLKSAFSRHTESSELVYWPRHLLPQTLPTARVFTYGYDTRVRHAMGSPVSRNAVYDIALDFLGVLEAERRPHPSRPLLFIAHSLGGIVVKELLRQSHGSQMHHNHLHQVFKATAAIVFFGTPHGGADPRGLREHVVEQVARAAGLAVNEQILSTLMPTSERLRELRDEFGLLARREGWIIYSFQEQYGVQFLGGKKVVEDVSSCLGDPSLEMTQHIASDHMDMCRFSGVQDHEYRKVVGALDFVKARISQQQVDGEATDTGAAQELTKNRRQLILDSMWFRAIDARYATIKPAHAKTCKWLLQRSEYRDWLDVAKISAHHGLLWIKGKPGSGKSTLLKYAVQIVRKTMRTAIVICFFFNARGDDLEKSTLGMYRSLLSQLLRAFPDIQDILDDFKSDQDAETFDWHIGIFQSLFAAAIRRLGERHLICFIDALDESTEDQIRDLVGFLEELGRPTATSPANFRVCLSSRHYPHISIGNAIEMTLEGQEGHAQDIANFLSSELKAGSGKVFETIKNEILERASGVFLWVALVVQILNKEYDHGRVHALRKRLKEIPDGLDRLFEDILTRDNARFEDLILCLQWILYAQRPLKREELYYAILSGTDAEALTPWDPEMVTALDMDKFILSCSKGLAETTKSESQTVQFIHESVRDFLLGKNGMNRLRNELDLGRSHERLRQSCCIYMKIDISADLPHDKDLPKASADEGKELRTRVSSKFPFLQYSVHNILFHADNAGTHGISQEHSLQSFPTDRWILLDNIFEKYHVRRRKNDHTSILLYITTQKSLASLTATLMQSYCKGSNQDPFFSVTLTAVLFDFKVSEDTIRARFLPFRQDDEDYQNAINLVVESWPNFMASKSTGFLPWAASSGLATLFHSLFDIDVNHIYDRKDAQGQSLLSLAALNGHQAVVEVLLAYSSSIDTLDKKGRSPLMLAAMNGHAFMIEFLLANGVSINRQDKEGNTPLLLAVKNGHEMAVKLLLANKAEPNVKNFIRTGQTPLGIAANARNEALVKLLLTNGASSIPTDDQGRTPLMIAASNGDKALVKLLLANEADPNAGDWSIKGPLRIAAKNGHEAIVKLLLDNEAYLKTLGCHGIGPLKLAMRNGHAGVVKLLVEHGAVLGPDCLGNIILNNAVVAGQEWVVGLLLDKGANPNIQDQCSLTPLMNAVEKGHEGIIKLLLEHGASLDPRDYAGSTALTYAAVAGHKAIVELLLSYSANSDCRGEFRRRDLEDAAQRAASAGQDAIMELLQTNLKPYH
ncbi:MAG: hypothetical protein Q9204_003977 [Flavoplaca sp. TL-2023a]